MGRKNISEPWLAVDAVSMGASIAGNASDISYLDNAGYQFIWTGVPVGTFGVEATIDGSTWTALDIRDGSNNVPSVSGSAGNIMINLNQLPYKKIRPTFTRTSGTGTLTVYYMSKQVGG